MRISGAGGGGAGTIVVDPDGLRQASAYLLGAAQRESALAARLRSHPIPELPASLAGVGPELAALAAAVAHEVPVLQETAQELRVRALWAEIADRLMGGYDLEGALLDEFKVAMASGLLTRYGEPWQDELANAYAKKLQDEADHGGILGFFEDVGGGIADFFKGAWDAVAEPVAMLYRLTPLNSEWTDEWGQLGEGLAYGATHPLEFGKALIGLDALQERGFAYWLGNLAPAAAATVLSGGAAGAVRGVSATEKAVAGAADASRLAKTLDKLDDVNDAARAAERAEDLARAARKAEGLPLATGETIEIGSKTLPAYAGKKTDGIFEAGGRDLDLRSGYQGPTSELPRTGNPGLNYNLRSHVEAHAAAEMRLRGIDEADLYINRIPCLNEATKSGCELMLERMLPEGAKLTVHGPHGFLKTYVGRPD